MTKRPARPAPVAARRPAPSRPAASSSKRLPIALIVGVALAIGLIAVIVVTMSRGTSSADETGAPTVTGEALPAWDDFNEDPARGTLIPEVTGTDFTGNQVSITRDGRPKVLMFFAHWCSVCQAEVPAVVQWLPGANVPEGVDLISVSTGVNSARDNYPPSRWLDSAGWTIPVIRDDTASSVGDAFGLTAYPYFVFVDADGKVILRLVGAVPGATLSAVITEMTGA